MLVQIYGGKKLWSKDLVKRDLCTAIVVGGRSSTMIPISKYIDELKCELKDYTIISVKDSLPQINCLPEKMQYQQVICIGGGKVIDIGKTISLGLSKKIIESMLLGQIIAKYRRISRLICVPTTAGSGSEATHFAVCYLNGKKYSISDQSILPDISILDPSLLESQSENMLKVTALDAVCQCIESMFSKNANIESTSYAKCGLELGLNAINSMLFSAPKTQELNLLQTSANFSGKAINITKTNLPHALSYYLTSQFNVSHGLSVSLFMEVYLRTLNKKVRELSKEQRKNFEFLCHKLCGSEYYIHDTWSSLLYKLSLPKSIMDLDRKIDRKGLLNSVNIERLSNFSIQIDLSNFIDEVFNVTEPEFEKLICNY